MLNRNQYRRQWDRWHGAYERRAFRIISRGFRQLAQGIPLRNLGRNNAEILAETNITLEAVRDVIAKVWLEIGLLHGRRVITELQQELGRSQKNLPLFNEIYQDEMLRYLYRYSSRRIVTIHQSFLGYVIDLMSEQMASSTQQDLEPIRDNLYRIFRAQGFYRWQMMRIARKI